MKLGCVGLIVAVTLVCAAGCAPDKGKQDVGMSARSSQEVPVNTAPSASQAALPAAPPAAAASDNARPVIVCFGDSITAGYGLDFEQSYPADLQRSLDGAGFHYRVVNLGVSGETTKDGLARVRNVLALKPEWVVVEFGGNDGLRGLPVAETQENLLDIVRALQRGGAKVLLAGISLPAQFGSSYIDRFTAMFPAVARQAGVPVVPFIYKGVYGVDGMIQQDGVHPTAAGAAIVARNIEQALRPQLRR